VGDRFDGAEAARRLLEADATLPRKILVRAYGLAGNLPDAKDLAQEGMTAALDPAASPWDPERQPDLLLHIGSVMNSLTANRRRGFARHPFVPFDPDDHERPDPAPDPEQRLLDAEERAELGRQVDLLRERLAADALALGTLELLTEGVYAAAEQAARLAHLGCEVKDIYRARERIAYHARHVVGRTPARVAQAKPQGGGD
jgi:DNA-directed RNA polymerase specialized sigma24 family protein